MPLNEETYINKEENAMEKNNVESLVLYNIMEQRITGAATGEKKYYFNSLYNDNDMVEAWCNQHDISHYRTVALVFGFANGAYIKELRNRNKEMKIVVYEPSPDIVEKQRSQQEVVEIINDKNIEIVHDEKRMYGILAEMPDYEIIKYIKVFVTPNYDIVYEKEFGRLKVLLEEHENRLRVNRNTTKVFGKTMMMNAANNLLDCVKQYSMYNLKKEFDRLKKDKIPAIVVAAGPSLDKNIKELKNIKGKAFIISVDTALKSLAKEDIVPDIAVTVDPHKPIGLFDHEKINHVPLVYALGANADIKQVHHGMRIYENSTNSILDGFIYKLEKRVLRLSTGGSVANDAFSLARELGFKTVILIGLDLAYPYNKMHTEGAYGKDADNKIKESDTHYIQVEDIYGNMVRTEENMNIYRQWFEREADLYPDIRIIDATEGGAKKKGMEILTLRDALKRECKNDEGIDFQRVIGELAPYFNAEERSEIIDYLNNIDFHMEALRKKMREGIKAYDKLDELNRKQKYTGKEFTGAIEKITEINNLVSDNKEMEYLQLYVAEEDYQLREVVFEEKDNLYEDIRHMANNGKKLVNSIIDATYEIERDMKLAAEKTNINI